MIPAWVTPGRLLWLTSVAGAAFAAWWVTSDHYQKLLLEKDNAAKDITIADQSATISGYSESMAQAGRALEGLRTDLNALPRQPPRLVCRFPGAVPAAGTAAGGTDAPGRSGAEGADEVDLGPDYQQCLGELYRADALRAALPGCRP